MQGLDRIETGSRYFWALAVLSAVLLLAPIRKGDLAGYDDALYAHIAKGVVQSGDWLDIRSNGHPALEHPPLLVWSEAALYSLFGFSDFLAKLPAALSGLGTIVLVYWLTLRLRGSPLEASLAMFVMTTSIYFLKYSARAMTDVPCTFLFAASICAWTNVDNDRRWYLITGLVCAAAQMSRGMIGVALPVIFAIDLVVTRRRPPWVYAAAALVITFLPITAWYWYTISANRDIFFGVHSTWLRNEVFGSLNPPWRRYTGAPEYLWMITKSYWPWLPMMIAGLVAVFRGADRRLWILGVWVGVVFLLCAVTRSRVLRYMLPAYPAFAVLAAIGMTSLLKETLLWRGLRILTPALALIVAWVALFPPVILHAATIRPIADASTAATSSAQRIAFYDEGNPRFDEVNQLQWYGNRNLKILFAPGDLVEELSSPSTDVFIVDRSAFRTFIEGQRSFHVLAESGNLICLRLQ